MSVQFMPKIKYPYSFVKDFIESFGYKLYTDEESYENVTTPLLVACKKGHVHTTSFNHIYGGGAKCRECNKIGIARVIEEFSKVGYTVLSENYKNQYTRIKYSCDKGHVNFTTWNSFQSMRRCPECEKEPYDNIVKAFKDRGYEVLSSLEEYDLVGSHFKFRFICPNGHRSFMTYSNFKKPTECGLCSKTRKKTYEEVEKRFRAAGFLLDEGDYVNQDTDMSCFCTNGHQNSTSLYRLPGYSCKECDREVFLREQDRLLILGLILSEERDIHSQLKVECFVCGSIYWRYFPEVTRLRACSCCEQEAESYKNLVELLPIGFKMRTGMWVGSDNTYVVECGRGHVARQAYPNIIGKRVGCAECYGNKLVGIDRVRDYMGTFDYTLRSDTYVNAQGKLEYACPKGHIRQMSWDNFFHGKRCPECNPSGVSRAEKEVCSYVISLIGEENVIPNDREQIKPYELDIFVPSKNFAIEYCGLYWHSEFSGGKDKFYHKMKYDMCKEKGIKLFTLFEDEYINKKDIVLNIISQELVGSNIDFSKCQVKEVDVEAANNFHNKYNLDGGCDIKYSFGMYFNGNLISCISFDRYLFLVRCSNINGCFDRLFLAAEKIFGRKIKIKTNLRYDQQEDTYIKLGFKKDRYIDPTPFNLDGEKRYISTDLDLKEEESDRVWDCGFQLYINNA